MQLNLIKEKTKRLLKHMQLRIIKSPPQFYLWWKEKLTSRRKEERLDSYQRDEPGAGHRVLALAKSQITRAGNG